MAKRLTYSLLALIGLLYLISAWAYATQTPAWQIPDEPAHYNYVRQIVEDGELPTIQRGDWDQDYQNQLTASKFDPSLTDRIDLIQYEDHQPPLYYLLQTPIYSITEGDIEVMRFFSALLGLGAVLCVGIIGYRLFPDKPWIGVTASAFMAFLPQRLAMMAGVNNDSLAESLAALVLLETVIFLTSQPAKPKLAMLLGITVGLVFLTKTTVYYVSAIGGLAILIRWWLEKWSLSQALGFIGLFAIPAVGLGLIWWIHSVDMYGGTDFLGLQRHDEVVVGQPRTDDFIRDVYGGSQRVYLENMAWTTFHSFWGQFGWMAVPMTDRIYQAIQAFNVMALVGLVLGHWTRPTQLLRQKIHWALLGLFILAFGLVAFQFFVYNLSFVQFQGRYFYPALVPIALLMAIGFSGWSSLVARRWPWLGWLAVLPALALAILAWYALFTFIVPNL